MSPPLDSQETRRFFFALTEFLTREAARTDYSDDAKESIEVASQCLQAAYTFSAVDDKQLKVSKDIEAIFKEAVGGEPMKVREAASEEDKAKAEALKQAGNKFMAADPPDPDSAMQKYTEAIELDPGNPLFYCNRAAAFNKKGDYYSAVEDCKRAIDIKADYAKAYGRMGLAYNNLKKFKESLECYDKAIEMTSPAEAQAYKENKAAVQTEMEKTGSSPGPSPLFPSMFGGGPDGSGMNLESMMNNPAMMNMASTMMQDSSMQNMMAELMRGQMPGMEGGAQREGAPPQPDFGSLLQAGQRLAEQMQQQNPELVNQLRSQMMGASVSTDATDQSGDKKDDKKEGDDNPPPGTS